MKIPEKTKFKVLLLFALTSWLSCNEGTGNERMNTVTKKTETDQHRNATQISVEHIDSGMIPKAIKYDGHVKKALRWKDSVGENISLICETGIHENSKFKHANGGSDAELFAYHFILENGNPVVNWKVYDFISDCPVDIEASFIKNTFQITDLDSNGTAEIWLMYKTACHGDVSPSNMKIIMYQAKQKSAMRGRNKVILGERENGTDGYFGGEYTFDKSFSSGPEVFRDFAKKMWDENIMQSWE